MLLLKEWFAKSRWVLWAILGFLVVLVLAILRGFLDPKKKEAEPGLPPVPKALQDKVNKAEEDGLKARVEATVKAEEQKKQLDEVLKIDDGAERRKRLAELAKAAGKTGGA